MGLLYYFESTVDFHGMNQKDFFKLWSKHGGEAAALFQKGIMKYAFKVHVTHWSCALQEGTRSRSFRRVALNWVGLITPLIVAVLNLNLIKVILFSLNVWFKINVGRPYCVISTANEKERKPELRSQFCAFSLEWSIQNSNVGSEIERLDPCQKNESHPPSPYVILFLTTRETRLRCCVPPLISARLQQIGCTSVPYNRLTFSFDVISKMPFLICTPYGQHTSEKPTKERRKVRFLSQMRA